MIATYPMPVKVSQQQLPEQGFGESYGSETKKCPILSGKSDIFEFFVSLCQCVGAGGRGLWYGMA
jgi:hypothetical protein